MQKGDRSAGPGIDRPATVSALIAIATLAPVTLALMPALIAMLIDRQGITEASAGRISSLYSLAGMVAGLLGVFWIRAVDRRKMLVSLALLGFCADLSAVWLHEYTIIAAGRFVTGFAASSVMIVVSAMIAISHRSERLFGMVLTAQALVAAALFFVVPHLSQGVPVLFAVLAACWLAVAPLALLVPRGSNEGRPADAALRRARGLGLVRPSVVLLALAFLCFEVATGALWTYEYMIGEWHGITSTGVGSAMSLAMLTAIPGGLIVTLLGKRYGRTGPLIVGLGLNVAFTVPLLLPVGLGVFALAISATNLLYTFALALFLTLLGDEDPDGRLFSIANMTIFGGLALGP